MVLDSLDWRSVKFCAGGAWVSYGVNSEKIEQNFRKIRQYHSTVRRTSYVRVVPDFSSSWSKVS